MNSLSILWMALHTISLWQYGPSQNKNWQRVENWEFQKMTPSELENDWVIHPCVHSLDFSLGNVEPQFYQGKNVKIDERGLHLIARKEEVTGKIICYLPDDHKLSDSLNNLRTCHYTSGWVQTKTEHAVQFGYIEARLKAPFGKHYFPAFWGFLADGVQQHAREIDIIELVPAVRWEDGPTIIKTNFHLYEPNDPDRNYDVKIEDYTLFNTYAVAWSKEEIIYYINDIPVRQEKNLGVDVPLKIILNLAINPWSTDETTEVEPGEMVIDYVRVYQLK